MPKIFIIAEIGINHNGSLIKAKKLIKAAKEAGADAVKFQKRNPDQSVPDDMKNIPKNTPWGKMSYLDYKKRIELPDKDYIEIDRFCHALSISWFASTWDEPSFEFINSFDSPFHKIPSAMLINIPLIKRIAEAKKKTFISTGMSKMEDIRRVVHIFRSKKTDFVLMHTTSSYPTNVYEINLKMISRLAKEFNVPVGYSGHEKGFIATIGAAALGAVAIERHLCLTKDSWGSDISSSLTPEEFKEMVKAIRYIEKAKGTDKKRIFPFEIPALIKLRGIKDAKNSI
ncbi:MAG: N-acetylneuraminate synthase [Spirochaetes bacterium]|nr:MAG: N-acetylneuraminate synthase [Spirochaetota bacterium]